MVCLADRGFYGFERFRAAMQTGAELVWRVPARAHLPREQVLADGSYLSTHRPARRAGHGRHLGLRVRVIEYRLHPRGGSAPSSPADDARQSYRLITTLLDPERAPAGELAQLYRERWEIERTFDELKTHQRGRELVLRSKTPSGVQQEAYGLLLTHYAIRSVMHEAALKANLDPDRLSFLRSLRAARRSARQPAGFSPHDPELRAPKRPRRDPRHHQPRAPQPRQPPRHQTQDEQLARQTSPPQQPRGAHPDRHPDPIATKSTVLGLGATSFQKSRRPTRISGEVSV